MEKTSKNQKRLKRCCFTGHRPGKLKQDEETVKRALAEAIDLAIERSFCTFITGMAQGGTASALLGAVTASLGLVFPSLIVILIVAAMLKRFKESPLVQKAFYGLRPASTGLIAAAGVSVAVSNLFDFSASTVNWKGWILAAVLWLLTNKVKKTKKLHPIVFIGFSALAGIVFSMG